VRAKRIVREILDLHPSPYPPHRNQLERLIGACKSFDTLGETAVDRLSSLQVKPPPLRFAPIPNFRQAGIPPIATTGDLAKWLQISLTHLDWFADERRTLGREPDLSLQHYTYTWVPKRAAWRLIEAPKPRLKELQRRILHEILDRVEPHEAAHGFARGRSCATAAAKHAGEDVVLAVDLSNFFLNTQLSRVYAVFRCLGYPHSVARTLTRLCSTITPLAVLEAQGVDYATRQRFATPHLPQGAPTSPALANLVALRLDHRLNGLARRHDARYTRYADDLTFSGDKGFRDRLPSFQRTLSEIVMNEGFALNAAKTRVMPNSTRQTVTGIVVNQHINVTRVAYDALKATLSNCVRRGAASQNRDAHADFRAHLDGRIAWVENINLRRGEKLRRIFDAINW